MSTLFLENDDILKRTKNLVRSTVLFISCPLNDPKFIAIQDMFQKTCCNKSKGNAQNFALGVMGQNGIGGGETGRYSCACSCHVRSGTESEEDSVRFFELLKWLTGFLYPLEKWVDIQ